MVLSTSQKITGLGTVTNTDLRQDSKGRVPQWQPGQRVWIACLGMQATVIQQTLSWDYPESFWGNVQLQYDDGVQGTSNSWQLSRVIT
jgi:hypothetical protein